MLSSGPSRSAWTEAEDAMLRASVARYGDKAWAAVAHEVPGRSSKSCSDRWRNFLSPEIDHPRKSPFAEWEVAVVVQAQHRYGNNWKAISMLLPGRTNRAVKNLFVGNLKWGARLPEISNRYLAAGVPLEALLEMRAAGGGAGGCEGGVLPPGCNSVGAAVSLGAAAAAQQQQQQQHGSQGAAVAPMHAGGAAMSGGYGGAAASPAGQAAASSQGMAPPRPVSAAAAVEIKRGSPPAAVAAALCSQLQQENMQLLGKVHSLQGQLLLSSVRSSEGGGAEAPAPPAAAAADAAVRIVAAEPPASAGGAALAYVASGPLMGM